MLKLENLTKSFDKHLVLDDVSLEVQEGSIFALVGPNGAGKTTLLRTIMGILFPDRGKVYFNDQDLPGNPGLKERVAYIPETLHFDSNFTGNQLIKFYRMTYKSWNEEHYTQLKQAFPLPLDRKIRHLSKGMKTQLAFLFNLSLTPELLLLDEPTAGLDPIIRRQILNIIVDQAATHGTTVVIASHNLLDLERICDSFGFVRAGKVILSEQLDTLKGSMHKVQVAFSGDIPETISHDPGLLSAKQLGKVHTLVINDPTLLDRICQANPVFIEKLDLSMEDIFITLLGGAAVDQ